MCFLEEKERYTRMTMTDGSMQARNASERSKKIDVSSAAGERAALLQEFRSTNTVCKRVCLYRLMLSYVLFVSVYPAFLIF